MWPVTLSLTVHNSRWPVTCLTPTRRPGGISGVLLSFYHGARSKFGKNTCIADRTNNSNSKGISSRGGIVFRAPRRPCWRNMHGRLNIQIWSFFCDTSPWRLFTIVSDLWHSRKSVQYKGLWRVTWTDGRSYTVFVTTSEWSVSQLKWSHFPPGKLRLSDTHKLIHPLSFPMPTWSC